MQEFSSVTASSYDADALAPLLSAKSAEGWDVISIVSAGTNIVAYLSRESSASDDAADIADIAAVEIAEAEDESDAAAESEEIETPSDATPIGAAAVDTESFDDDITPSEEIVVGTPADAVDEPAGWGAAPEETTTSDEPQSFEPESVEPVSVEPVSAEEVSVEELAAQVAEPEPAVEEPAVSEPAAVESTVPAGWYADPSGRYELRYWDGSAWTEHVSRAGQQFTDPPVA